MNRDVSQHESDARQWFDRWASTATFQRLSPWLRYVQDQMLDRIDFTSVSRILDVACGSGWAVNEAAGRLPDTGLVCGADLSVGMLAQRPSVSHASARFLAASAQRLPFGDGIFDAVICTAAFHHFPMPAAALIEIRRVLRPGGMLLLADTCRDQSVGTWIWDRLHRCFEKGHVQYYRTDELHRLTAEAGFQQIEMTTLSPSYAQTRKLIRKATLFTAVA